MFKQKLITHANTTFCTAVRTCVYAKKNDIVTSAPVTIVYFLPNRVWHMYPASTGPRCR